MNHPHLAGLYGMRYWVVREVPHWFIPCVQLLFRNSLCMSSFYKVVQKFLTLHKAPLGKQSSLLCHRLVVEFLWWVVSPRQGNLKMSIDLLQNLFRNLETSPIFNW